MMEAAVFAAEKHKAQRRKGNQKIPYINHLLKVVQILIDCGESDEDLILAALLHDVIEDTDATAAEITALFGKEVCSLVLEVTDDKNLSYSKRKEKQVKDAPGLSNGAKKIKIADKISNIYDISHYSLLWTKKRKVSYLDWSQRVINGCAGVNEILERKYLDTLEKGYKLLGK